MKVIVLLESNTLSSSSYLYYDNKTRFLEVIPPMTPPPLQTHGQLYRQDLQTASNPTQKIKPHHRITNRSTFKPKRLRTHAGGGKAGNASSFTMYNFATNLIMAPNNRILFAHIQQTARNRYTQRTLDGKITNELLMKERKEANKTPNHNFWRLVLSRSPPSK